MVSSTCNPNTQRQEGHEFKGSLVLIARPCFKNQNKTMRI